MKRIASIILMTGLALGLMASSCNQDPAPAQEPSTEEPEQKPDDEKPADNPGGDDTPSGPQAGTYKFVASPLQGTWKEGDQIYIHGNLGTEAGTVTVDGISADGKTATAQLSAEMLHTPADPDGFYAAWPAAAVKPYKGINKTKTTFEDCDRLLTVAYLEGDTFNFADASSQISFTVNGDYDQYALCANNFAGLTFTQFNVEYSSSARAKYSVKDDGNPFKTGTLEPGKPVQIWMPGNMSFKSGVTIYVGKNGEWPLAATIGDKISLKVGETLDLGDITSSLKTFTDPGPKGIQIGERTKYKVKFNELSGLCVSADGNFLWTVGDNGELAQISFEGELLNRVELRWESGGDEGGYDTEGITVNSETGDLLVSMEQNYVGKITPEDQATAFSASKAVNIINTIFRIKEAENYGNSGTEGITYYKDGLVYVGAQDGPADLFLCEIATGKVVERKTLGNIFPSMSEIAGLCYDPLTDWLWVVDSNSPQKFFALAADASRVLAVYPMADTDNPESICVDHKNKCIWVGDDAGSSSYVYKFPFPSIDDYNVK